MVECSWVGVGKVDKLLGLKRNVYQTKHRLKGGGVGVLKKGLRGWERVAMLWRKTKAAIWLQLRSRCAIWTTVWRKTKAAIWLQ